ncbi:hypothetical protein ACWDV7_02210 [Streptomyces sp. NPDC003362]
MPGFTKGALSGVELFRFRNEDADVRLLLDGQDVFRIPHAELQRQLEARGHVIPGRRHGFLRPAGPQKIVLAKDSGFDYPVDEDGNPLFYDYVLVAGWI